MPAPAIASREANVCRTGTRLLLRQSNRAFLKAFSTAIAGARPLARRLNASWAVYEGRVFQEWLEKALRDKLGLKREVRFRDLPGDIELAIVATRLDPSNPLAVYQTGQDPNLSVAGAVRRSMSIPFFFVPVVEDGALHIDGGVASNFPAWLFTRSLEADRDPLPTLGFRLVSPPSISAEASARTPRGFIDYARAVFNAMLWASAPLLVRAVPRLYSIELNVGDVDTFSFDVNARRREETTNRSPLIGARPTNYRPAGAFVPLARSISRIRLSTGKSRSSS